MFIKDRFLLKPGSVKYRFYCIRMDVGEVGWGFVEWIQLA
jgi:hypothetical protein